MKIIKVIALLTLQIIVTANFLNAQTIEFSLNGKINRIKNSSDIFNSENISTRFDFISDSTQVISTGLSNIRYRNSYQAEIGFEFGLGMDISLNERFSIATGLGFTYSEIRIQNEIIDSQFDILNSDTIPSMSSPPPISLLFGCSYTINSISNLPQISANQPIVSFIDLSIPIGIQYKIIPDKLDLQIGGLLQTPIYADAPRKQYDLQRTPTANGIECEWVIDEYQDDSMKRFSFARISLQSTVRYHFLKNVSAEIGVRKMLNNAYRQEEFNGPDLEFRPLSYTFGFRYTLGQKKLNNDI